MVTNRYYPADGLAPALNWFLYAQSEWDQKNLPVSRYSFCDYSQYKIIREYFQTHTQYIFALLNLLALLGRARAAYQY